MAAQGGPPLEVFTGTQTASRRALLWARARDSLWLIPAIAAVVGGAGALLAVQLPRPRLMGWTTLADWVFGGGAEGARGVLSTIAGSLITVTGVVFSVTIVALQLASSQFTPRVLRGFVADRANQIVLGIFIGTFTYTLLVLRTIRTPDPTDPRAEVVPELAVTMAVALLLVSIGALIFFINHAARSVQVSVILRREVQQTLRNIATLFPRVGDAPAEAAGDPPLPLDGPAVLVTTPSGGYLQSVQADDLVALAEAHDLVIRMEPHVGDFILAGEALATVWPADAVDPSVRNAVSEAFLIGPERTLEQDVELGIVEISDIAVRALSPSINDPTTAMMCIDRLAEVIAALGQRFRLLPVRHGANGRVRFIAAAPSFERVVGLAFDQVRHYGAANPSVAKKLLDSLGRIAPLVPSEHRPPLAGQVEAVLHVAREIVDIPGDLASIELVGAQALARVYGVPPAPER